MIRIVVYGKPEPAGSKRAFQHAVTGRIVTLDANRNAAPWKQQVAGAALQAMHSHDRYDGPVDITMIFYRQRPGSHYGTGRNATTLKPSAPWAPATKPDALKLARGVEDALTGIVYNDDALIVDEHLHKRYGTPERVEILVRAAVTPVVIATNSGVAVA